MIEREEDKNNNEKRTLKLKHSAGMQQPKDTSAKWVLIAWNVWFKDLRVAEWWILMNRMILSISYIFLKSFIW